MDEEFFRRHSARFICYSVRHESDISIRSMCAVTCSVLVSTPFIMYYVCFFAPIFFSFLVLLVCCCFYSMRLCRFNYSYFQLIAHKPASQWFRQTTLTSETLAQYFCFYFYSPIFCFAYSWHARVCVARLGTLDSFYIFIQPPPANCEFRLHFRNEFNDDANYVIAIFHLAISLLRFGRRWGVADIFFYLVPSASVVKWVKRKIPLVHVVNLLSPTMRPNGDALVVLEQRK